MVGPVFVLLVNEISEGSSWVVPVEEAESGVCDVALYIAEDSEIVKSTGIDSIGAFGSVRPEANTNVMQQGMSVMTFLPRK